MENIKTGLVIKAIASFFYVELDDIVYECRASTKLKRNRQKIITGDYVLFNLDEKYILEIKPRANELIRPKIANVFNDMLIFSATEPNMNFGLLDRMILIMEKNKLETTIVITKMDLLNDEEKLQIHKQMQYYQETGYKVYFSEIEGDVSEIKEAISQDKYVFTGQTGVGKSTLINKLLPDLNLETQAISKALGRGKHTTREVTFYHLNNSYIIDTPGFSALEINLTKEDVRDHYADFVNLAPDCKFSTCYHLKEPGCAVKAKVDVDNNDQLRSRYENYVKLMEEL